MTINDIIALYESKKELYGEKTYRYISAIMQEMKARHKAEFKGDDHEQSWRAFKGKNIEKLIQYIITDGISELGLAIINGNSLERTDPRNLSIELATVKRNLLIDYHKFGAHLPDVDIIIYNPKTYRVLAVLSSKVTLRERIAQTGYWKFKLASSLITKHIKVYFVTPDEDGDLAFRVRPKKGRAIIEADLDGSYVLTEAQIEESDKVKTFDKLIDDLQKLLTENS
ncbi:MAG: BsaWI family type II restriction enzyme [Helicobacteraceae bacterium]|jgi:type II restriction enzyme|nr:BsaWI family type II restriction enzyme [Helicobacteraceae bacterium]